MVRIGYVVAGNHNGRDRETNPLVKASGARASGENIADTADICSPGLDCGDGGVRTHKMLNHGIAVLEIFAAGVETGGSGGGGDARGFTTIVNCFHLGDVVGDHDGGGDGDGDVKAMGKPSIPLTALGRS